MFDRLKRVKQLVKTIEKIDLEQNAIRDEMAIRLEAIEKSINYILSENEMIKSELNNELMVEIGVLKTQLCEEAIKEEEYRDYIKKELEAIHWWPNQNIRRKLFEIAGFETAQFVIDNLNDKKSFLTKYDLLDYAIGMSDTDGMFMEFGVFSGDTINFISQHVNKKVYGFDSFEGLPETWRTGFEKGVFKTDSIPEVNNNVELVKGFFDDSLPKFLEEISEDVSFLHVDCDLYSSAKTVFDNLHDRLRAGTIIVFDEYFNYPGWKDGEYKAFMEMVSDHDIRFEYIGYVETYEQAAVRIL